MRKLFVLLMCLALAAGSAFADDAISFRVSNSTASDGNGKYVDDPALPEIDSPRCPDCEDLIPCGTPMETEPNDACENPDALTLSCGSIVYGKVCDDNSDYFLVTVPGYTELVVTIFDGVNCDRNPAVNARMKPYRSSNCEPYTNLYTHENITATNPEFEEASFVVKVKRDNYENEKYSLVVACEPINVPCPNGYRNYCADPVIIPAGLPLVNGYYHYEHNENSCCAQNIVDCIHSGLGQNVCGLGTCFASGPDIVYEMVLTEETVLRIETGVIGGGDTQFMIVGDCSDPDNTCFLSRDFSCSPNCGAPEIVEDFTLQAGTYYIITSMFQSDQCSDIYIIIDGDHPLPVELTGFEAIAGDASVALNWSTASESNLDYFELMRDGATVARVNADNSPTGGNYGWTDANLANGRVYSYTLIAVDLDGSREELDAASATPTVTSATVTEYALYQNYPNPFNPETNISFDLVESGSVTLTVYNPLGQLVATLVNGSMSAGRHTVTFDGAYHTSGLYYYRLEAGDFSAIRKMVLMK